MFSFGASLHHLGAWFQKHKNVCRCTGYKPLVDAVMDAAKLLRGEITASDLSFQLPADGKIWGTDYPRPSAVGKVTGTIDYGADFGIKMPAGTPNVYYRQGIVKGEDTAPLMEQADVVVSMEDFFVGRQPHLPIEPDVALAYYDDNGNVQILSKSIGLELHALMIAPGLGLECGKTLFLSQFPGVGGTFGYKFSPTTEALVGAATIATGKPCFQNFNYYQQITYTGKRY